jgi:hypothetical protein
MSVALSSVIKIDLGIHGKPQSIVSSLIAPNSIDDSLISGTAEIADSKLATISTAGKVANSATTAVSTNTPSSIVLRDASGDFAAGDVTVASLIATTLSGTESSEGALKTNYTNSYYLGAVDNFNNADLALDAQIAAINAKKVFVAYLDNSVGGETSLAKPVNAPPIPDDDSVELYIDGRKVRKGADKVFTVNQDGSGVTFLALTAGQDVELKYVAYDGATAPSGVSLRVGEIGAGTTFTTFQVSVGTTATQINTVGDAVNRLYAVENLGTNPIYIGASDSVTTSSGFAVYPRDTFQITLTSSGELWAIAATGTVQVSVIKGH